MKWPLWAFLPVVLGSNTHPLCYPRTMVLGACLDHILDNFSVNSRIPLTEANEYISRNFNHLRDESVTASCQRSYLSYACSSIFRNCSGETLNDRFSMRYKYAIALNECTGANVEIENMLTSATNFVDKAFSHPSQTAYLQTVSCPKDFHYLNDSHCVSCRSSLWLSNDWERFSVINIVISALGWFLCTFSIFSRLLDIKTCMQTMVFVVLISSALFSSMNLIAELVPSSSSLCRNEPQQDNGFTVCSAQSIISTYTLLVACAAWMIQSVNLLIKMRYETEISDFVATINLILVLGLPLIPTLYLIVSGRYGFNGVVPWCLVHSSDDVDAFFDLTDVFVLHVPSLLLVAVGVGALLPTIGTVASLINNTLKIEVSDISPRHALNSARPSVLASSPRVGLPPPSHISPSSRTNASLVVVDPSSRSNPSSRSSRSEVSFNATFESAKSVIYKLTEISTRDIVRTPLQFALPFLIFWMTMWAFRFYMFSVQSSYQDAVVLWKSCMISDYNGFDASVSHCGSHPRGGISPFVMAYVTACFSGHSILVVCIHPPVTKYRDLKDFGELVCLRIFSCFSRFRMNSISPSRHGHSKGGVKSLFNPSSFVALERLDDDDIENERSLDMRSDPASRRRVPGMGDTVDNNNNNNNNNNRADSFIAHQKSGDLEDHLDAPVFAKSHLKSRSMKRDPQDGYLFAAGERYERVHSEFENHESQASPSPRNSDCFNSFEECVQEISNENDNFVHSGRDETGLESEINIPSLGQESDKVVQL